MPSAPEDLDALARSLLANGPVKTLPAAPKRVRIRLGGRFVADTTRALYVWEHEHYPAYYVPASSFADGALTYTDPDPDPADPASGSRRGYSLGAVRAPGLGGPSTDRVIVFGDASAVAAAGAGKAGVLAGLVRVAFSAAEWFEEDVRVRVHPKDPFRRVDVLLSSRPVRVLVSGVEVAAAAGCFQLYETGLPVRFYLPATAVRGELLRASDTVSACPYKGSAHYFDVVLPGGARFADLVWCYSDPVVECAAIAGLLCFYNEKVDVELDGEVLGRPSTVFS
ncbi:DUF427-domain-containing protein [Xylaria intraflava]|nr:DUF427-domain-containing protein [Xylaria intraflava]